MATYTIEIDITYTTTKNASTAVTNINNVLSAAGRPERVTMSGNTVTLLITGIPNQDETTSLTNALTTAWGATARSGGKFAATRVSDNV